MAGGLVGGTDGLFIEEVLEEGRLRDVWDAESPRLLELPLHQLLSLPLPRLLLCLVLLSLGLGDALLQRVASIQSQALRSHLRVINREIERVIGLLVY